MVHAGGNGPAIVLLHGYGSDRQSWLATTPALQEIASVWLVDLPAHGRSSAEHGDGSIAAIARYVQAAIDSHCLENYHLAGHSLGGRLAIELAGQAPHRVQSLVLLAPAGLGTAINVDFLNRFSDAESVTEITPLLRSLVHDPKMIGAALSPAVLKYLQMPGIRPALQAMTKGLVDSQDSLTAALDVILRANLQTLTLWGEQDQINPHDPVRTALKGGEHHVIKDCGHLPHIEKRVQVNQILTNFYRRITAG